MIVTPDMPKEPGTTVEFSGALIELANLIVIDDVGIKVTHNTEWVQLEVDSFSYPHSTAYMEPDDAEALGRLLIDQANKARGL